jgi:CSLREA domain-containing protein
MERDELLAAGDSEHRDGARRAFAALAFALTLVAYVSLGVGVKAAHADANIYVISSLGDAPDVSTADGACQTSTGDCTLRAAIQQANADAPGAGDEIDFGVPGMITLGTALPNLTNSMFITGTTSKNTISRGDGAPEFRIFTVTDGAAVELENLIVQGGVVSSGTYPCGGGIDVVSPATLHLTGSTVRLNSALSGGGICADGPTTITGSLVGFNFATAGLGGGIFGTSTVNATDSIIRNNQGGDGGGVFNAGTFSAQRVTIFNNASNGTSLSTAHGGGGVLNYFGGTASIVDSTVANNTANGALGGGILSAQTATLKLVNATVAGNAAATGGGVDDIATATDTFLNTLIAHNTVTVASPDLTSASTSSGNNLIGDGTGALGFVNGTKGDKVGTGTNPIDAKLETDTLDRVVVDDNGGPTPTVALRTGSPAINAGSDAVLGAPYNLATDQRGPGFARKQGTHVDIGAYETAPK